MAALGLFVVAYALFALFERYRVAIATAGRAGVRISWSTYLRRALPIMLVSLAVSNLVWLGIR